MQKVTNCKFKSLNFSCSEINILRQTILHNYKPSGLGQLKVDSNTEAFGQKLPLKSGGCFLAITDCLAHLL